MMMHYSKGLFVLAVVLAFVCHQTAGQSQIFVENFCYVDEFSDGCHANYTTMNNSLIFYSPNYPKPYTNTGRSTYRITGKPGEQLVINATYFDIDATISGQYLPWLPAMTTCIHNFTVFDSNSDEPLGTFCGMNGPRTLISNSNTITIQFDGGFDNSTNSSISATTSGRQFAIQVWNKLSLTLSPCPNNENRKIELRQFCDGVKDCSDGSDEICHEECGVPEIKPDLLTLNSHRIVNGEEAVPNSWPWQIAMLKNDRLLCGGSLISNRLVLTAAHCCAEISWVSDLGVLVGAHHNPGEGSAKKHQVKAKIPHPLYQEGSKYNNDFCILQLKTNVTFSKEVTPVCLPRRPEPSVGTTCYVTGWGTTYQSIFASSVSTLRQTAVEVFGHAACNKHYKGTITESMFCGYRESTDTCQGDSGGPFVCYTDGNSSRFDLYGVTSFGEGCAKKDVPGVYALTSASLDWVAKVIYDTKNDPEEEENYPWRETTTMPGAACFMQSSIAILLTSFLLHAKMSF